VIPTGTIPSAHGEPWSSLLARPEVVEATAEARDMVDRVLVHRVLRSRSSALAAESALRGARASAALEGADLPLDVVRAAGSLEPVLAGALRVHAELPRLRQVWHSSPRQALARLHLLAAAGLAEPDLLGRPLDAAAATVLGQVSALSGSSSAGAAPAVVVAAVIHGELAGAPVFAGGNGVVARAASRLVLADRGLDPALLCMPEIGHVELGNYGSALDGYRNGDAAGWVVHCARAVLGGAREALAVAEALVRG
jgi:hypothetical protein